MGRPALLFGQPKPPRAYLLQGGRKVISRIQLSEELRSFLLDPKNMPDDIAVGAETYVPEAPVASGYKSAVWKVVDRFGRPRALKLAISDDYLDRSFLEEVQRAAPLERYEQFARLIDADTVSIDVPGCPNRLFVGFVEEWIDGLTLRQFIDSSGSSLSSSFLVSYVNSLSSALSALQANGLRHDDLHIANVMIASPPPGDTDGEHKIKIIDTGSLKPADPPTKKAQG